MTRKQPELKSEFPQPLLTESRDSASSKLEARIRLGKKLQDVDIQSNDGLEEIEGKSRKWRDYNIELLETLFTNHKFAKQYREKSSRTFASIGGESSLRNDIKDQHDFIKRHLAALESILERLDLIQEPIPLTPAPSTAIVQEASAEQALRLILKRFHVVANQLLRRHSGRPTLEINDEYDVQDLLHTLLRVSFNDVRPEEWTPSYAGGSSRMDFLLKSEQIVVEAKKTRQGLADGQLGAELLIDIGRYKASPDCKMLVCFIYDPEGIVRNPVGLVDDLEKMSSTGLQVRVVITPS